MDLTTGMPELRKFGAFDAVTGTGRYVLRGRPDAFVQSSLVRHPNSISHAWEVWLGGRVICVEKTRKRALLMLREHAEPGWRD